MIRKRKPNLGGVKAGRKTRERTRNQVLKDAVAANKGRPIEIGFEDRADNTVVPTGPYSTQWGNYFGEMIRSIPLYHPSWQKVPAGDKARLMATLGSTRGKPDEYTDDEWEKYINFWNDPANAQRAETNRLNRSKSTVVSRHGSRSIPLTRHLMKLTSATQEEPSEDRTRSYSLHTVNVLSKILGSSDVYRKRELEATCEAQHAEINAMVQAESFAANIPDVGPVRSFPSDMSLGNLVPPWHQFLDQKIRGAHFSLGIVAEERFVIELTPSMFPQRHVAGEGVRMLLGKGLITVVMIYDHKTLKFLTL
ncbi:hypothetical protein Tco_0801699 [Tanacetum coccineum]|uniref:Uncharacterized protein n=1 Tax=Tanacetum coccineum TaxID=301880 RepID=A0ABQ4ZZL0_9ASTR